VRRFGPVRHDLRERATVGHLGRPGPRPGREPDTRKTLLRGRGWPYLAGRAAVPRAPARRRAGVWPPGVAAVGAYRPRCECQVFLQLCAGSRRQATELTTGASPVLASDARLRRQPPGARPRRAAAGRARGRRSRPRQGAGGASASLSRPRSPEVRARDQRGVPAAPGLSQAHCKVLETAGARMQQIVSKGFFMSAAVVGALPGRSSVASRARNCQVFLHSFVSESIAYRIGVFKCMFARDFLILAYRVLIFWASDSP
jgi:hypothetical protein